MTAFSKMKIWSVYVMAAPDSSGVTYFKVGRTSDIAKRVCAVQTGCPLKIKKAWVITLWGNGAAQSLEAILHEMLSPFHSHGEWFAMRTDNLDHKRAMNAAFEKGIDFASQMKRVRWRELSVDDLRAAMAELRQEQNEQMRQSQERAKRKAMAMMCLGKRRIL